MKLCAPGLQPTTPHSVRQPTQRRATFLCLRCFSSRFTPCRIVWGFSFAVDHPRNAEAIAQHPKTCSPESWLEWHHNFASIGERLEYPFGFGGILSVDTDSEALWLLVAVRRHVAA